MAHIYVNYNNAQDAARAMEVLNFTSPNNKSIRVMYSHLDPSIRKSGAANIFIKNLDKTVDNKALHDTFSTFGNILSCKIATDSNGQSKGYGFVQFDNEEAAQNAINKLNGMLMNDKQVCVGYFLRKQERETSLSNTESNYVCVKNLAESVTDDDLKNIFSEYGTNTSSVMMRDADGKSKCFGFVNFENADDDATKVEALNGKKFDDKEWYVGRAQKKSEREQELKSKFEQTTIEADQKSPGVNLYIKNLDDTIDDDQLRDTITSCKVMRDPHGVSRGFGMSDNRVGLSWQPKLNLFSSAKNDKVSGSETEDGGALYKPSSQLVDGLFLSPSDPKKLTKLLKKRVRDSAGKNWFDMPAQTITPELKKDLQLLKLRSAIDPKRHYKKGDSTSKILPKYFQVGTVIESASEFFSGRLPKTERKATLADELLSDGTLRDYRKRKVREIEEENRPAGVDKWKKSKSRKHAKSNWKKTRQ